MRTTTSLALLAAAGMAVYGCSTMVTGLSGIHCNAAAPACPVAMTITNDGSACKLSDPGTVTVDKGHSPVITWELDDKTGTGYQFPRNGIELAPKPGFATPPEGVFQVLGPGPATTFRIKDTHKDESTYGKFNYKVTVVKRDGSPGCQLDPPIYNGP